MNRLRRFAAFPAPDQLRILALIPFIATVRLALWFIPFQTLARWLNRPLSGSPQLPPLDWARLVRQASSVVPQATCLTQSLVLQWILHGRACPSLLYIGVRQDDGGFAAHSWVQVGHEVILGGPDVSEYAVLATVAAQPRA